LEKKDDRVDRFFRSRKTVLFIIMVVLALLISNVLIAFWWIGKLQSLAVPSEGILYATDVMVYGGDIKSENGSLHIDWGTVLLGGSKSVSFYLRSLKNTPIILAFNLTDWVPEGLSPYMTLSWNYSGVQLAPSEEVFVRFNLNISASVDFVDYLVANNVDSFSFKINVYAL
jgi:predicted membrane channel-forming protein YqfA (hemolysin III family)